MEVNRIVQHAYKVAKLSLTMFAMESSKVNSVKMLECVTKTPVSRPRHSVYAKPKAPIAAKKTVTNLTKIRHG